jgi:hypothetical protein
MAATTPPSAIAAGGGAAAAIGWRAHSGWAALVAVAGPLAAPVVVERRRVELVERTAPGAAQPYHAARDLPPAEAERFVGRCRDASLSLARQATAATAEALRRGGFRLAACGLLQSSARPLPAFAAVLASHALVHTAEGELFRDVLAVAAGEHGLAVLRVKEREILDRCAAGLGVAAGDLERRLAELGRALGPPWRQDEKLATLVAWLALSSPQGPPGPPVPPARSAGRR